MNAAQRRGRRGFATVLPARQAVRLGLRAALSLAMAGLFVWLLQDRWAQIDLAEVQLAFGQLEAMQWAVSLGLTALSFWAVGHYDAVVHRHFSTGLPQHLTRRAGICAIAISQTIGLGLISGAIVRWRMLPGVTLWQATRLTAAVALSFLAGWAVVTACVLLILPDAPFKGPALAALSVALLGAGLSIAAPRLRFRWPNAFTLARLIGLCAVDTLAAATALWMLCPPELGLTLATLLPAFLLALGAGLALGTPGGMGAFEVSLLALLPATDVAPLLAAVLAWRVVYFALPAVLASLCTFAGPKVLPRTAPAIAPPGGPDPAEFGLRHQGHLHLETLADKKWLCGRTGHLLVTLLEPNGARGAKTIDKTLAELGELAQRESRFPVCYKASARLAARARQSGAACRRTGWHAFVNPLTYRLAASKRAGLRRKLRRAEASGVIVQQVHAAAAPWEALDQIAAKWTQTHGAERGFSMGRYSRAYLSRQRLYIASQAGHPIAFASFHVGAEEWTLDLMRHSGTIPDGTMQLLVQCAIDEAAKAGLERLSLAAVADGAVQASADQGGSDLASRLIAALSPQIAAPGLFQFKQGFAPQWQPLYLIAPNRLGLLLAGLGLWRAICRPAPLMPQIEQKHAQFEFALPNEPWHIAKTA